MESNCLYHCISHFLLNSENYYNDIKNEIINWIDNNRKQFNEFFGDDELHKITKEKLADDEYNYIKKKDSWGGFITLEIACLIFYLSIAVYIDNGNEEYQRYSFSENKKENSELVLLEYVNNNHFNLLYDKDIKINIEEKNKLSKKLIVNNKISKNNIQYEGEKFNIKYVLVNYKSSQNIYDEISNYLKSIQKYEKEIEIQIKNHPNWHRNQILALFNLDYPERISSNSVENKEKRRIFRKEAEKYILDHNNRLNILNPLNKEDEKELTYKIPLIHEKDIIIKQAHYNNNHCGRDSIINILHRAKWYWYGMNRDISNIIKLCIICTKPFKFKSLTKKPKIILDNGPHFRYVADLWHLCNEIREETGFNYVLDIIDHFSKWYAGYPLKTKDANEVLKNIEKFIENFGKCKILQVDNGTEFKNKVLQNYCQRNQTTLIHSSPYHPQTNGVCEVVHKEIRKYIYTEYFKNKENFDLEDELFNITKIHNNKIHSTTKRVPKEIRDIDDVSEIQEINNEIIKTLSKKIRNYDEIDSNKSYVIDFNKVYINKDKILKKKGKYKKSKHLRKIPVKIICEYNKELSEYIIEIMKSCDNINKGESYIICMDTLEEVDNNLWDEYLK